MAGALYGLNFSTVAASKFDFNTSILVLVFVVLGGIGNIRGSIIAATLLTILPELLRAFANYRMLVYAIVLILVMLATNNPTLRGTASERIIPRGKGRRRRLTRHDGKQEARHDPNGSVRRATASSPSAISTSAPCWRRGIWASTSAACMAVEDFNLTIGKTEIAGLIGPNGAGKTTVFNLLTKVYQPTTRHRSCSTARDTAGMNTVQANKLGIARTFQNIRLFDNMSVEDNVRIGLHNQVRYGMLSGIFRLPRYWQQRARSARARAGPAEHLRYAGSG